MKINQVKIDQTDHELSFLPRLKEKTTLLKFFQKK
jgi:hypothetical protein